MLKGTSHPLDKVVGRMRPTNFREFWELTVEKVAVNAVMAGCKPEYLPVVLAHAATGYTARSSSTTSLAMIAVVNGPIRKEIGMGDGIGAMGPYNHANTTIGRAYNPLLDQWTGRLGAGRHLHGHARQLAEFFDDRFAEAEERSPWTPFHRAARLQAGGVDGQHFLRRPLHDLGIRPARDVEGKVHPVHHGGRSQPATADRDGPDRGASVRRSRLRYQGKADRMVRRECETPRRANTGTISGYRR